MKESLWTVKLLLWLPRVAADSGTSFRGPSALLTLKLLLPVPTWGWRRHPKPRRDEVRRDATQKGLQPTSQEQHRALGCGYVYLFITKWKQPFRGLLSYNGSPYSSPCPKPSKSRGARRGRVQGSCCMQIAQCHCTNPSHSPLPLPFFFLNK